MAVVAELADGRRLEFPDGTDPSVVQATVKRMVGNTQASPVESNRATAPAKPVTFTPEMTELSFAEKLATKGVNLPFGINIGLPKDGFSDDTVDMANNIASGATSLNRGIGNLAAGEKKFLPKDSPTGNPVDKESLSYLGGQIIDPTSWALMGGMSKLPGMQIQSITGPNKLLNLAKNVGSGSTSGTVLGGLSEDGTAADGGVAGGVLGGLLPALGSTINYGVRKGRHLLQNKDLAGGRFANEIANHSGKRDQIIAALEEKNLPFTGTANAGQATAKVGSPEFAALQEFSNINKPAPAQNLASFQEAQRASTLNSIGRGENELAAAVANRSAKSNPLYEKARNTIGSIDKQKGELVASIDGILLNNRNSTDITQPLNRLKVMVERSNQPKDLISLADEVKSLLAKTDDGKPAFNTKVLTQIKEMLDDKIGQVAPDYTAAKATFKELSGPVNRMETGQLLQKTLKTPLQTGERAAVFAKAVDDAPKTLKNATGFPRFNKLDEVLDKTEVSAVDRVVNELMTDAAQKQLAQKGSTATAKILGAQVKPPQIPNPLSPTITYANSALRFLTGKISDKTLDALAVNMNNPAKMAQLMRQANAAERDLIGKAFMKAATQGAVNVGARQGGE